MGAFHKFPLGSQKFVGYTADPATTALDYVTKPTVNMLVTDDGKVEQRTGYREEFSIGVDGKPATAFYHSTYDIAFFALGTKVYYRDFTEGATYDTGITLTDGTTTRFDEFFGDVYLSNTTDGLRRIVVMRLNDAAATLGDATVTVDVDGAARLSVFGDTSGNIRIQGTNEAFASLVVATGVLTLTGTLSQSYSDNTVAIFIDDISSGREKPSKFLFWKSRLHLMGFPAATNADQPNNTVMAGKFVIGETGAAGIEDIIDFTYGSGGSTKIVVGGGGATKNLLGAADTIYFLNENKIFATAASSITTSGSGIGLTIPDAKDEMHGCLNEDSATLMGQNALTYITNDKRIMRIPIDTQSGAALSAPEEDFDVNIREHLKDMNPDQTGAFAYYYRGGRQTIYQVKISGQWYWFIYDNNIVRQVGSNIVRGTWQPPQQIGPFTNLFERKGVLYGTDASDDTVYSIFTTFSDNLLPIYAIFATGEYNIGNAMVKRCEMQGEISQSAQVNNRCYVTNETAGRRSGSAKVIDGADYTYTVDRSVGAVPVGEGTAGETVETAKWKKGFDVFPSEGSFVQLIAENEQEGGWFSITSYLLDGQQYPTPFSSSL